MTMIHINWIHLQLQLLFLFSISGISICESRNGSCQDIGCGSEYDSSRSCQCNKRCRSFINCCDDYNETCGSCQVIGCGKEYRKSRLCQCNKECHVYYNCCNGFKETCEFCQDIGCGAKFNRLRLCQCNKECRKNDDCCSDYSEICESCQGIGCGSRYNRSNPCQCYKECRSFNNCCSDYNENCGLNILLVIVSVGIGLVVLVSIAALLCFIKRKLKRTPKTVTDHFEERVYLEISNQDTRPYDHEIPVIDGLGERHTHIRTSASPTPLQNETGRHPRLDETYGREIIPDTGIHPRLDETYEREIIPDTGIQLRSSSQPTPENGSQFYFTTVLP